MLKTRNRLVNFRLTEEELENLKLVCLVKGARSISEFARAAVIGSMEPETESGLLLQKRLAALDMKITEIGVTLQFVAELLKVALKRPVPSE